VLLVVAATSREAEPLRAAIPATSRDLHGLQVLDGDLDGIAVRLAVTGVARSNTAFVLSRLLLERPAAVLQVGVGGTFDPDLVPVGGLACATSDTYADLGVLTDQGWMHADELGLPIVERDGRRWYASFPCDGPLTAAVADRVHAATGPFATVETVTGTDHAARTIAERTSAIIESMEGAAAAHACLLAGVPFVELRSASNVAGPRDRSAWRLDDAIEAAGAAALAALPVLAEHTA